LASRKEQREEARRQREEREAEERKKQRRKRRIWQIGAGLVVVVAIVVVAVAISSSGGGSDQKVDKTEENETAQLFEGIAQSGDTLGNPDAKVTIYEFADLQCPFCKQYTETVFPQLVEKYVKPGKVKMVWRNLTFLGPDSITGARAVVAAGAQNKTWNMQHLFYENQGTENTGYVTDKFIENLAAGAGVDLEKLRADMAAPFVEQALGDAQQEAQEFGVNSTPSFLIQVGNGEPQRLEYKDFTLEQFSGPIDEALSQSGGT
jgi:protein-disulfide isomerase